MDVLERIKEQVEGNPIIIYMKGTPQFPQCGFSAQTVAALRACGSEFAAVNIFEDPELREALKAFSNWPTRMTRASNRSSRTACAHDPGLDESCWARVASRARLEARQRAGESAWAVRLSWVLLWRKCKNWIRLSRAPFRAA